MIGLTNRHWDVSKRLSTSSKMMVLIDVILIFLSLTRSKARPGVATMISGPFLIRSIWRLMLAPEIIRLALRPSGVARDFRFAAQCVITYLQSAQYTIHRFR